jgi:signal transduction histidine kinase
MKTSFNLLSLSRPLAYVAILVLYLLDPNVSRPGMALYAFSAAFFVATSCVLAGWIPAPRGWEQAVLWSEIVMVTIISLYVIVSSGGSGFQVLYMPLTATVALTIDRQYWLPAFAAIASSWVITSLPAIIDEGTGAIINLAVNSAGLLFFGSTGALMRSLRDEQAKSARLLGEVTASRAALERVNEQLRESAARQQQMAVVEERQRLAREIHDSVAHGLTALVVQLQAARKLMKIDPARAESTVTHCEEMAREALQETRRAVRALHPSGLEQQADVDALARLARDYGAATGMQVSILADEGARTLPPDPDRLEQLYRIFQEALTNAQRHGRAKSARAVLSVVGEDLELIISNDGLPPTSLDPGVGLKSMAERTRAIGGQIAFVPDASGLTIRVTVPIKQGVSR